MTLAEKLRKRAENIISNSYVTICLDGWTNARREKGINFVVFHKHQLFFWKSVEVVSNSHRNISKAIAEVEESIEILGTRVVAIVGDNAASLQLAIAEHTNQGCFGLRCAAHSIQLIVKDLSTINPLLEAITKVHEIIANFEISQNKEALHSAQKALGTAEIGFIRPVSTRWNSFFHAAERVLRLKPQIQFVCGEFKRRTIETIRKRNACGSMGKKFHK